eukprot:973330-Rhodomonas_salina.3
MFCEFPGMRVVGGGEEAHRGAVDAGRYAQRRVLVGACTPGTPKRISAGERKSERADVSASNARVGVRGGIQGEGAAGVIWRCREACESESSVGQTRARAGRERSIQERSGQRFLTDSDALVPVLEEVVSELAQDLDCH